MIFGPYFKSLLRFLMSLLRSATSMEISFSSASMSALPTRASFFFSSSRNTRSIRTSYRRRLLPWDLHGIRKLFGSFFVEFVRELRKLYAVHEQGGGPYLGVVALRPLPNPNFGVAQKNLFSTSSQVAFCVTRSDGRTKEKNRPNPGLQSGSEEERNKHYPRTREKLRSPSSG